MYAREDILCRKIVGLTIPKDIQAIPIEINIETEMAVITDIQEPYTRPTLFC